MQFEIMIGLSNCNQVLLLLQLMGQRPQVYIYIYIYFASVNTEEVRKKIQKWPLQPP